MPLRGLPLPDFFINRDSGAVSDAGFTDPLILLAYADGDPTTNADSSTPIMDLPNKVYPASGDPVWTTAAPMAHFASGPSYNSFVQMTRHSIATDDPTRGQARVDDLAGSALNVHTNYRDLPSAVPNGVRDFTPLLSPALSGWRSGVRVYNSISKNVSAAALLVGHGWANKIDAYRAANYTAPTGSPAPLKFDTVRSSASAAWDAALNTSTGEVTIPTGESGLYYLVSQVAGSSAAAGHTIKIKVDGADVSYRYFGNTFASAVVAAFFWADAGEVVSVDYQAPGGNVLGSSSMLTQNATRMSIARVYQDDMLGMWNLAGLEVTGTPSVELATVPVFRTRGAGALTYDGELLNQNAGYRLIYASAFLADSDLGPTIAWSDDNWATHTEVSGSNFNTQANTRGGGYFFVQNAPAGRRYKLWGGLSGAGTAYYTQGQFGLIKLSTETVTAGAILSESGLDLLDETGSPILEDV